MTFLLQTISAQRVVEASEITPVLILIPNIARVMERQGQITQTILIIPVPILRTTLLLVQDLDLVVEIMETVLLSIRTPQSHRSTKPIISMIVAS